MIYMERCEYSDKCTEYGDNKSKCNSNEEYFSEYGKFHLEKVFKQMENEPSEDEQRWERNRRISEIMKLEFTKW
jgi:hypothetical protein